MKLVQLKRLFKGEDSSLGALWIEDKPICFIVEDEYRKVKVKGETRIPAGKYELKKRISESPKTLQYRKIYPWFDYHIELQNVLNFKYVYIHHGNDDDDTDGCLLTNYNALMMDGGEYMGGRSRDAFEAVYKKLSDMMKQESVFIDVIDE